MVRAANPCENSARMFRKCRGTVSVWGRTVTGRGIGRLAALALALSVLGGCGGFVGPGYYNGMGDGGGEDDGGGGMGYGGMGMPFFGGMGYGGMGGFGEGGGWGGGDDD